MIYIPTPINGRCLGCSDDPCVEPGVCEPCGNRLRRTYSVTIQGLGGCLAAFNGVSSVSWIQAPPPDFMTVDCLWMSQIANPRVALYRLMMEWELVGVHVSLPAGGGFYGWLKGPVHTPCEVLGADYGFDFYVGCGDSAQPGSCALSVGATCVVS
jgi:hypothetical protein